MNKLRVHVYLICIFFIPKCYQILGQSRAESEVVFSYDFDNTTDVNSEDFTTTLGTQFLSFIDQFSYMPNMTDVETIILTDIKSITQPTLNGELCTLPFDLNGRQNYFCAINSANGDTIECNTTNGLAECDLGNFMLVKRGNRPTVTIFEVNLEFSENLYLEDDQYYEFEFDYLIHEAECDIADMSLKVYLFDSESFEHVLFDSNKSTDPISNLEWNHYQDCFLVTALTYLLFIRPSCSCSIVSHGAFIALDNVVIRKVIDPNLESACQDIRVTTTLTTEDTTSTSSPESTSSTTISTSETSSSLSIQTTTDTSSISTDSTLTDFTTTGSASLGSISTETTSTGSTLTGTISTETTSTDGSILTGTISTETISTDGSTLTGTISTDSTSTASTLTDSTSMETISTEPTSTSIGPTSTGTQVSSGSTSTTGPTSTGSTSITSQPTSTSSMSSSSSVVTASPTSTTTRTTASKTTTTKKPSEPFPVYLIIIIALVGVLILAAIGLGLCLCFCKKPATIYPTNQELHEA